MNTPKWYGSIGIIHACSSPWQKFWRMLKQMTARTSLLVARPQRRRRQRTRLNDLSSPLAVPRIE
jgi:hypothetical protein